MEWLNNTWIDDRIQTVWRSEFVECRPQRANNSIPPQICLESNKMFCCYNNALLDEDDYCCSFEDLLLEHRALFNFIHLCVWINLILFVVIIFASISLLVRSKQIIEEENSDNEEMIRSVRDNVEKKKSFLDSLQGMQSYNL